MSISRRVKPPTKNYRKWLTATLVPLLLLPINAPTSAAPGDIQVSVFNQPNLNGGNDCSGENFNLINIVNAIPGYEVDGSIVDFEDGAGQITLASQLAASRFFFMTDMENADPGTSVTPSAFLPESAKTAFRNWTNSGGVMVMTGTHGDKDVRFLNNIYGWNLANRSHSTATEVTANTTGTPFANATSGVALTQGNATESLFPGTVPNFKAMWQTSAGDAEVAVIQYGAGYVIYMGWDFYNAGPGCGFNADPWVTGIVPAALRYASELSQSGLENATTSGGDLKYTFSQSGTAYYVVVPAGSTAPTNAEIKAGSNYGAVVVGAQGIDTISANVERVFPVSGLTSATDFTAYIVTEYDNSGTPTFSTQQVVNFSTKPGVPSVASVMPDAGKVTVNITPSGTETNFEYSIDGGATWVSRSPASNSSPWEISGLTNGTTYNFQFRSAFKTLRGDSTAVISATPALQPAYLTSLVPSVGTLAPTFTAQTLSYSLAVENSVESLTFTPTSSGNSITVNGRSTASGQPSTSIVVRVGTNEVTVSVVRPEVGAVATVYTIQVTRASSSLSSSPGQQGATIAPTPIAKPNTPARPTPTPIPRPNISPNPVLPQVLPTPQPSRPIDAVQLIPTLDPTPNAAFSRSNPIPPEVVNILASPLAYEASAGGRLSLPELNPTQSIAFENGSPVVVQLVLNNSESGYVLNGDGWVVNLEATDIGGQPLVLDESGNLILNEERAVSFSGTGFAPGSIIKVWLFSDPSELTTVIADANGNFTGTTTLPNGIPEGQHTVQLNGLSKDGQVRSVALGVVVQPELIAVPAVATFDFAPLWNLVLATAGVVMVFWLVLIARRRWFLLASKRRKRKEEKAELKAGKIQARKQKRQAARDRLLIDEIDPFLAQQVDLATPSQQFPVDSRRKLGKAAPPRKSQGSPFKKNRP